MRNHSYLGSITTSLVLVLSCVSTAALAGTTFTFNDGAEGAYSTSANRGQTDQPIGRVSVFSPSCCGNVTSFTIELTGSRTGLSNFKLWDSTDSSFGGDSQFGSTVASDPNTATMDFTGVSSLAGETRYYFLTADVSAGATGSVLPRVRGFTANTSVIGFGGNDPMASTTVPLPVSLSRINAE